MFHKIQNNLEEKGYSVSCFATSKEAAEYLNREVDEKTVGFGGSMTLKEMELYDSLSSHNEVYWHWNLREGESGGEVLAAASRAQIYISSVNGIAETGEIVNIDGTCNRVSAIVYGHEKVYLVVGKNKIAKDYDEALYRARNTAAPLNAKRLGRKTPCAANGNRCYDCKSSERICRNLSVLWDKPSSCAFEILLIDEHLGY